MALGAGIGFLPTRPPEAPPGTVAMGERVPLADSYWSVFEDESTFPAHGSAPPAIEARP
jgi:hypothetical protein